MKGSTSGGNEQKKPWWIFVWDLFWCSQGEFL